MNATLAARMIGADFLKLRHKRGIMIWALVLALAPVLIYFLVASILHASEPLKYGPHGIEGHGPAGGAHNFSEALPVIALVFGPLAGVLIGVEAGAGDVSAGVFRDLVVTGRSRLQLFASRVPAALAMCWIVNLIGYALLLVGSFVFASNLPTPSGSLILNTLGFALLGTGVLCVIAVGLASLTTSKPGTITAMIAWQILASPLLASFSTLGSARKAILSQAIAHFSPVTVEGGHGAHVTMGAGLALLVLVVWMGVFLALGAWRTRTIDA